MGLPGYFYFLARLPPVLIDERQSPRQVALPFLKRDQPPLTACLSPTTFYLGGVAPGGFAHGQFGVRNESGDRLQRTEAPSPRVVYHGRGGSSWGQKSFRCLIHRDLSLR